MKKIINIFLVIISLFILSGCLDETIDDNDDHNNGDNITDMENVINIYTLNDFHGAIFENESAREIGISKIGRYLIDKKTKNPENTVIISAGDMFQGTAVSSLTKGKVIVDLMNTIGFDAMALGNHEFDWGVSHIERYVDGDLENGEAEFPFLGANIYHTPTESYVEWAKPYTVIERGDIKIGILGLIGEDLTSSIIGSVSKDFQFTSQMAAIKKYVPVLRTEENVDIVIVASHSDTELLNSEIRNLEGNYYVDAVINGHTHKYYAYEQAREGGPSLVVVQSGNNGKFIGQLSLELDLENKTVISASAGFVEAKYLNDESTEVNEVISTYQSYIDIENEVYGTAGSGIDQVYVTRMAVNTLEKFENADIGIINAGGIRSGGFPIIEGANVTYGSIFKIIPFDNKVITLNLTGSQLKQLAIRPGDMRFSSSLDTSNWTLNGVAIDNNQSYKIAVIDYVYYRDEHLFSLGSDIVHHDDLFRDLVVDAVKDIIDTKGKWIR